MRYTQLALLLVLVLPRLALACSCAALRINSVLVYGQSRSTAGNSTPVIDLTAQYPTLTTTFLCTNSNPCGTLMTDVSNVILDPTKITGFEDLVETTTGETVCSGLVNSMNDDSSYRANCASNGWGAQSIANLSRSHAASNVTCAALPGSPTVGEFYCNLMVRVRQELILAAQATPPTTVLFSGMPFLDGEADVDIGTTGAAYEASLVQMWTDVNSDIPAIQADVKLTFPTVYIQTEKVHLFIDQVMSGWATGAHATNPIAMANLQAAIDHPNMMTLVDSPYNVAYSTANHQHFTGQTEQNWGDQAKKAWKNVVVGGATEVSAIPYPLTAKLVDSTHIDIKTTAGVPPLVIDETWRASPNGAAEGFEYTDTSGSPPTISSVAVLGDGVTVELTMSGAVNLANSPTVAYAYTASGTNGSGCTQSANGSPVAPCFGNGGSVRDSDTAMSRIDNSQCTAHFLAGTLTRNCCFGNGTGSCGASTHLYNPLAEFDHMAVTL